ncbi:MULTISPECIES: Arm DNA-binding domain-containing protein [Aquimarina]|uniref:Arm DNA-binding domain-containing protein n=1 Tax=Aquimarina TaxID=290174 RepID=UPI000942C3CA|nr:MULTISPECIES: Arm DNA-binding domain-containing protein [Aquimarina]
MEQHRSMLVLQVNGKRAELSLKRKVVISHWDIHKNKLKGLSGETRLINTYLEQVYRKLFDCYQKSQHENKLISIS